MLPLAPEVKAAAVVDKGTKAEARVKRTPGTEAAMGVSTAAVKLAVAALTVTGQGRLDFAVAVAAEAFVNPPSKLPC